MPSPGELLSSVILTLTLMRSDMLGQVTWSICALKDGTSAHPLGYGVMSVEPGLTTRSFLPVSRSGVQRMSQNSLTLS